MQDTAYRSDETVLRARLEVLLVKRRAASADIAELVRIVHHRRARIAAGKFGVAGAVVTLVALGIDLATRRFESPSGVGTGALVGTILLTLSVWVALVLDLGGLVRKQVEAFLRLGGELRSDVERLESGHDVSLLREAAQRDEKAGVFWPLAAALVLSPLSLHFLVGLLVAACTDSTLSYLRYFDAWIAGSAVLVGIAHVSLVYRASKLADALAKADLGDMNEEGRSYGWKSLGWAVLYSCLPGAIAWLVPVALSALTGALIVPLAFSLATRVAHRERTFTASTF